MPEYLLMGDLHLSDRPPSSCTDDYLLDLFTILNHVARIAHQRQARAVIWAGDVFHHKTPGRTSHQTVRATIELARTFPCPVYVVPGNHDMLHDRIDSIDATQPLGVVIASGAVKLLNGWMGPTDDLDRDGFLDPVYGVPWLQTFTDATVFAALADYRDGITDPHSLVVTHAPLYPLGRELVHEFYPAVNWAEAMGGVGNVYYGHVHEPHGIHGVCGVNFCNAGALSRGSLHEHNLTRPVQIAAWSSDTGEFELIDVPHKPASEVFRLQEAQQVRTAKVELEAFLASVGAASLDITSIETVMDHVEGLDLGPSVLKFIRQLLEEANS